MSRSSIWPKVRALLLLFAEKQPVLFGAIFDEKLAQLRADMTAQTLEQLASVKAAMVRSCRAEVKRATHLQVYGSEKRLALQHQSSQLDRETDPFAELRACFEAALLETSPHDRVDNLRVHTYVMRANNAQRQLSQPALRDAGRAAGHAAEDR